MKKHLFICCCVLLGCNVPVKAQTPNRNFQINKTKIEQLFNSINTMYVDSVNFDPLTDKAVSAMLKELDPHTSYIPKKDVADMTEPLQGSFSGVGITFQMIKDTINVMEVIVDGPSDKVGILAGDKIVRVDDTTACGEKISNNWVRTHLRGTKGTKVTLGIVRGRHPQILDFVVTRDKIPMYSINVAFMADKTTGYVRLERFAATSNNELMNAIKKLKAQGMKDLILDLRGNGGGYLNAAYEISDQFISAGKIIVYTDNFRKTGETYRASAKGVFEEGKLIVLVDEHSASASEIVSGCVQDWDRGLVMGRRTFGKGLVEKPLRMIDQSEVRLTISHYYTPTGRCIQKPYNDGLDNYYRDIQKRATHGELYTADSIKLPDSLKFTTPCGRTVYGGGGIMPDIFIPLDTTRYSTLYNEMFRKGVFSSFCTRYLEDNRQRLKEKYPDFKDFENNFTISDDLYRHFLQHAKSEGVSDSVRFVFSDYANGFIKNNKKQLDSLYKSIQSFDSQSFDTLLMNYMNKTYKEAMRYRNEEQTPIFIKDYLRYEIARGIYGFGEAYRIFLESDETFQKAVDVMHNKKIFKKYKIKTSDKSNERDKKLSSKNKINATD